MEYCTAIRLGSWQATGPSSCSHREEVRSPTTSARRQNYDTMFYSRSGCSSLPGTQLQPSTSRPSDQYLIRSFSRSISARRQGRPPATTSLAHSLRRHLPQRSSSPYKNGRGGKKRLLPDSPTRRKHTQIRAQFSPVTLDGGRATAREVEPAADEDSKPHTIPTFSLDGDYEWHHTSHVQKMLSDEDEELEHDLFTETQTDFTPAEVQLITIPVLTKDEQLSLAATPAHPKALTALYGTYVACCLAEKLWRFGLPAILSTLLPSMQPIAVLSFTSQLVVFLGAPWVGQFMDTSPRVPAFNSLCTVQTAAIVVTVLATVSGLQSRSPASLSGLGLLTQPWFLVVMAAGAVDKLTGLATGVAFERDWVILLAGQNRPIALASANAILRRVDLFCELAGPLSFGWMLSNFHPLVCLYSAMALTLASLPVLLALVHTTDRLSMGALRRSRHSSHHSSHESPATTNEHQSTSNTQTVSVQPKNGALKSQPQHQSHTTAQQHGSPAAPAAPATTASSAATSAVTLPGGPLAAALQGWKSFLGQSVFPASLAYVLLYFNAVLSPGGLMTSFLTQRGVDVSVIGVFRGACAAMGFAATFISAPLVKRFGVLQAGASALLLQSALLALSSAVFFGFCSKATQKRFLPLFLALVVLSRLGHWLYDVIDAQIFQTAVPSHEANLVGTTEIALASLAELLMLGVAIVIHDVSRFGQLALLSTGAVLGATAIYCFWLSKPDERRNAMFPKRPEWTYGCSQESRMNSGVGEVGVASSLST